MRHKSKKEEWEHRPPSNLSSDGVDAWYMMQRQREQELRKRRQEAEQLLRGYRAPYKDDASIDTFGPWSPKSNKASHRMSMGDMMSDSLTDPAVADVRRQSTMPRLQSNYNPSGNGNSVGRLDCDNMSVDSGKTGKTASSRSSFPPERTQFLQERRHYDGTGYDKHADPTAFSNGRALFNSDDNMPPSSKDGQVPPHPYTNNDDDNINAARYIDTTESRNRLREAGGDWRNSYMPGATERRSYGSAPGEMTRGHGMRAERKSFGSAPGESGSYGNNTNRNVDAEFRDVESRDNLEDNRNMRNRTTRFSLVNEREGHEDAQSTQAPLEAEDPSSSLPLQAAIPETVWRDFISPGKSLVSDSFPDILAFFILLLLTAGFHKKKYRTWCQVPPGSWPLSSLRIICLSWVAQGINCTSSERIRKSCLGNNCASYLETYECT